MPWGEPSANICKAFNQKWLSFSRMATGWGFVDGSMQRADAACLHSYTGGAGAIEVGVGVDALKGAV